MKRSLSLLGLAITLLSSQVIANPSCPRCVKIESERAAQGPQHAGYYDEEHPEEIHIQYDNSDAKMQENQRK